MSTTNRRRRLSLLAATALVAVGLAATFAATTDSSDTGTLELQSEAQQAGIDVRIADIDGGVADGTDCSALDDSEFVQDMTVDLLVATDQQPESAPVDTNVCLRNFGEEDADFESLTVFDLASTELGCTNDEALDDPDGAGCGTEGELDGKVVVRVHRIDDTSQDLCDDGNGVVEWGALGHGQSTPLADGEAITVGTGDVIQGETSYCVGFEVDYHDGTSPAFTPAEVNGAQTDSLAWKLEIATSQAA